MTKTHTIGVRCRPTAEQREEMCRLLTARCYSDAQLAEVVGVTPLVVASWRRRLPCHVESYTFDARGRLFTPCWRLGVGENAPRPGPQGTPAQRMARLRAERKK